MTGEERLQEISDALGQGIPPTLAQGRWLVEQHLQDRDTIQVFTDAALEMARTVIEGVGQRQQARRQQFDARAGQFIDV